MELRQVVKSSQTASVLQALASPEVDKRPVVSERCEGTVVLALESEGRSGLKPALSLPQFAQISITFAASPPPVPPASLLCIYSLSLLPLRRGTNPFATVKLKPTTTNDRSAPRVNR